MAIKIKPLNFNNTLKTYRNNVQCLICIKHLNAFLTHFLQQYHGVYRNSFFPTLKT
jgi:hypothetical protein